MKQFIRMANATQACAALLAVFAVAPRAFAGIADTTLPQFADGKASVLVLAVPGVVKRGRLQTDFLCTSLAGAPIDIGVEVFDPAGVLLNDVGGGVGAVTGVSPGQTVTIGTSGTKAFLESAVIPLSGVAQGSARVVASSSQVRCTVLLLDSAVTPPASVGELGGGIQPAAGPGLSAVALPEFSDAKAATHAALVPGVVKRGRMETDVFCTSLATVAIDVGVEIFAAGGSLLNNVSLGNGAVLDVAPGATVSFGTTGSASFLEDDVIAIPGVAQGLARIVSTSGQLLCAAFTLDALVSPPVAMTRLDGAANAGSAPPPTVTRTPIPPTATAPPTSTRTRTPTRTRTRTPTLVSTSTRTFTSTATSTQTATLTVTFTPTLRQTVTSTSTSTSTSTPTWTPTVTPTGTPTSTFTSAATLHPTSSPTLTHTGTRTTSATPTKTATVTGTRTHTPTRTATHTGTRTTSATPTKTATVTGTRTRTPTVGANPSRTPQPSPTATHVATVPVRTGTPLAECPGDCNSDGEASIDELVKGVNIALGRVPVDECSQLDLDADGTITIDELVRAVQVAQVGCVLQ